MSQALGMRAARLAFRFRLPIFLLLYVVGFLPPWERAVRGGGRGTLWLAASTVFARSGWAGVASATLMVTLAALAFLSLASILRVWGTAHLGAGVMQSPDLQCSHLTAGGPYRWVRNPLYLGSCLQAVGVSVLMPVSGAAIFIPAFCLFVGLLILAEESFLGGRQSQAYEDYRRRVPRIVPAIVPRRSPAPGSGKLPPAAQPHARPQWRRALLAEIFPLSFTMCFAIFAWRYNARILIQCLLICYGASLIVRAWIREPLWQRNPPAE